MAYSFSYAQVKAAMTTAGYTVSAGDNWLATDQAQFELFVASAAYGKGYPDDYKANYGAAFQVAPTWLGQAIPGSSGTPEVLFSSSGTPHIPGMSGAGLVVN